MPKLTLQVSFFGRVQGVGFRMLVLSEAEKAGVAGWVKNMPRSDHVDACFQGERAEVEGLIEYLKSGVAWVRIERVIVEEVKNSEVFKGFEIRY